VTDVLMPGEASSRPSPSAPIRPGLPSSLPAPRGPLTEHLLCHFARPPHDLGSLPICDADVLFDDDAGLALHLCYELCYLGLPFVEEHWETEPSLVRERTRLERAFEQRLLDIVGPIPIGLSVADVRDTLIQMASAPNPRSLSVYMEQHGTFEQICEFAIHRSAYQLKEADPHTWAIPRLTGRAKAALVEIQRGEYGDGAVGAVHANLFAEVLAELGLDHRYGAYIDRLPGVTLATENLATLFGLHRRWRGALVGHLALFEMCSVGPMGRYAAALRRLGMGHRATRFYDEHVVADEHHQVVALNEMVVGLLEDEPILGGEVVFGARALDAVERAFADHLLDAWTDGRSSLLLQETGTARR
jgi:hypothetical protein